MKAVEEALLCPGCGSFAIDPAFPPPPSRGAPRPAEPRWRCRSCGRAFRRPFVVET